MASTVSNNNDEPKGPVYLLSFSLENVRCFGPKQTLDLSDGKGRPAQWTILLGDNGVGKTTLLQTIAGLEPTHVDEPMDRYIPRLRLPSLRKALLLHRQGGDLERLIETSFLLGNALNSKEGGRRVNVIFQDNPFMSVNVGPYNLLINTKFFGYGASRRSGTSTSLSTEQDSESSGSLFRDDFELVNAEEWLLQLDYAASKQRREEGRARAQFELVRSVLIEILPEVRDIQVIPPEGERTIPAIAFTTPYGNVGYRALGLGYRTMVTWMVDLAAKMIRRYPDSPNPIAEPAIVLIDEIDLHLHPSWQRKLIRYLSERFINTQFIVTAHSPLVVQAASDANIAVLRREGDHVVIDQRPRSIQGWRVDQLLTSDLFDLPSARAEHYDALMKERTQLLSQIRLSDKDRARLAVLEAEIEGLPTGETPADIEAMSIIHRAARLLKAKDTERAA